MVKSAERPVWVALAQPFLSARAEDAAAQDVLLAWASALEEAFPAAALFWSPWAEALPVAAWARSPREGACSPREAPP